MVKLFGRSWSRTELERYLGDFSQVAGVTQVALGDGAARGVRALIFRTGSGLEFWVLVDRAFDIAKLQYRGVELGWQSPVGIRAPWFHEVNDESGASFHRSFSGFLVTAGLDHTGAPYRESAERYFAPDRPYADYPLHGRITTTPGQLTSYGHQWRGEDRCVLFCEGIVKQAAVFGEHLVLIRRYEVEVGTSSITIRDQVRNNGFYRTPHMMLYHINLGFPLLDNGAEFVAPVREIEWAARDARAEVMGHRFQDEPRMACVEQAFVHDVGSDDAGMVKTALINRHLLEKEGVGVGVEYSRLQLPYLIQWQNFQAGSYCMAIEPSTTHALGRLHAERHGDLIWLEHGDERTYELAISVLNGQRDLDTFVQGVRSLVPDVTGQSPMPRETL